MQSKQNKISPSLKRHKFKASMCPFIRSLFRTALIITGNPRAATKYLQKIYRTAWSNYRAADHVADFAGWLAKLASRKFVNTPQ